MDKDLNKLGRLEDATRAASTNLIAPGLSLLFLALAGIVAAAIFGNQPNVMIIIVASVIGGYMALNIGANDVANNVGPAVGSKALTMLGALAIAAIFECAGALLAGGDVVKTIAKGIIDPALVPNSKIFIWAMMAALLSSALWVNLATYIGAPVSTTHSVVGGVLGGGIAAVGFSAVNWVTMSAIAASWVISPLLGGIIAALFLAFIKIFIIYQQDKLSAARRWVPLLVAIMFSAFSAYLMLKGLKKIWRPEVELVVSLSVIIFIATFAIMRPVIKYQSKGLENRNQSLRRLFHIPLICSAALLSFAHGANDVANAVGPLAAIIHAVESGDISVKVEIPTWVMLIGGFGISLGLFLYGPKLIRTVGEKITKMNPMRAFCVALAAAITVILASAFGLPVSSTHITVGAVFGVGFFREFYVSRSQRRKDYIKVKKPKATPEDAKLIAQEQRRRLLVRRSHFMVIITAWIITVPATAILSGLIFTFLNFVVH
ncbi:MAG: phosphate transporter [Rhodomicrobium sp.]|nr:MAG: phosphate transporter [Rhodomicrobium sp.]